ncbi:cell division protein FtsQ [Haematobacter missouriensis]|mgnify:FL=1|uniref:Cell division protein FtsQ n=2 Tax=Haematobacter missouriensis TaxID=366616 RepID=A0A212ASN8_9RHOB|nr:cell division protein FtsQ [Haematobacter missouriensis]OWJ75237.1 cell division protein FtsQ [Haematobacter missouriensis]OWJ84527.1 cell division protein FtsQ [Haematobacter missouriensis]
MRRDPAPSRIAYRLQRIWLTPLYRRLIRTGVPVLLVAAVAGIWFSSADRRAQVAGVVQDIRARIESRPELQLVRLTVSGASPETAEAIRSGLAIQFPVSSLALDLTGLRAKAEELDAVRRADVRVRPEGTLEVAVTERLPIVVWRNADDLVLLDEAGHRVAGLENRIDRPDLPLIAGPGVQDVVPEALRLLAAAEPLRTRIRGLVRIGERRWNLVLDRGQEIMLPEQDAVAALERVIALDQAEDLLDRDVTVVDMRIGRRPTLRLSEEAIAALQGASLTARNTRQTKGALH